MKRYGQRCPVARALDVIGERWTPLIIRELLIGPRRYTDLIDGLPGIGTNVLTTRLADLQAHGIIEKRTLPPPTPVAVYELTEAGRALGPVLRELRAWGSRFGPAPRPADVTRPSWILQSAATRAPGLPHGRVCELQIGKECFELTGGCETVEVKARAAVSPDAVVTIEPRVFMRLTSGKLDVAAAADRSHVAGDRELANDLFAMLEGSAR